jgi:two-component system, NtrC family, nitrogen regulation response regulator GlnG
MDSTQAQPFDAIPAFKAIVGRSPALRQVLVQTARLSRTRLPVLVTGESGTGKELFARALHDGSPVASGPFVAVNCGTLTRELAESELFGHERGAFTGAGARKTGWFEESSGGTLVLDEVGELPLDLQPKLLRVLETGRLRRVGGQGEVAVNVRVVALTLRDLRQEAARGRFRLDLYHRLAGCQIHLPPLRERRSDIAVLVDHFLDEAEAEFGPRIVAAAALDRLCNHDWPGNVRELRNTLRRAAALVDDTIDCAALDLDVPLRSESSCELRLASRAADAPAHDVVERSLSGATATDGDWLPLAGKTFQQMQAAIFGWAIRKSRGSRRQAAKSLGISRSTFCDRVRKLGLA